MSEYIKREDATRKVKRMKEYVGFNGDYMLTDVVSVSDINAIPAADVEPVVRANWEREFREVPVKDGSRCVMKVLYKCAGESGCKEYSIINSKRCPNCGAHMERSGSGE